MPATWKTGEFNEGGYKGITEFIGRLSDVEEDIESSFGGLQLALHFYDVEITESVDPIALEGGKLTIWQKQSNKKSSTNAKMVADWNAFVTAHNLEGLPKGLYDKLFRWKKCVYDYGEDLSPGTAYVPVEIIEEGAPKAVPVQEVPVEVTPEAVDLVMGTISEGGVTKDQIRRELAKKSASRTTIVKSGGIDNVLAHMVESGVISELEGVFMNFDNELPF